MRRLVVPVVAAVLLSSCIEVGDFGAYWAKGFVDPALAGTWKKIGIPGQKLDDTPGVDQLLFTNDGRSYSMQLINLLDRTLPDDVAADRKKDNDVQWAVRTLKIGNHGFLMVRTKEGKRVEVLQRYEIRGNILGEYTFNHDAAVDFLAAKRPTARNIVREGRYVVIHTFDDEVFQILSEIADARAYWDLVCQYKKGS
jgi:hypothetical protein